MKTIKVDSRGRININAFKDYLDVKKVKTICYSKARDGSYWLTFFGARGKQIKLKKEKK